jgi:hypothetical protein
VDPLSSSSAVGPILRTLQAGRAELSAVLKLGRVIVAEVLETRERGNLVLSIAGQRVLAKAPTDFQPGRAFLATVESESPDVVLRLVPEARSADVELVEALRAAVAEEVPHGRVLVELAREVRALLVRVREPERAALAQLAAALEELVVDAGTDGPELAMKLRSSGLFLESKLARGESIEGDLKSLLLRVRADLPEGPARAQIERALRGLEAEQLLDVARMRSGDPTHASLPIQDGVGWSTVQLWIDPDARREQREDGAEQNHASSRRVRLAVDFSNVGPVRADLRLVDGRLAVRFVVEEPEIAARMRADLPLLEADLAIDGREPQIAIALESDDCASHAAEPSDVRFLIEHPLVDLEG